MNIREFLFYENMTVAELAEKARLSRGYLDAVINRGLKPSRRSCEDLREATMGKVSVPDGLYVPRPRKRGKGKQQDEKMVTIAITG